MKHATSDLKIRIFSILVVIVICFSIGPAYGLSRTADPPSLFDFHSGFWLNLHLTLYQQSKSKDTEKVAVPAGPDWATALAYYRTNVASRDLLFDDMMVAVKDSLEDQEHSQTLISTRQLTSAWIAVLQQASHYYRTNLWQNQDRANQQWIEHVKPLVSHYGNQLTKELSAAYQTPWPSELIRVDVANYASWAGAYTTVRPTRITISSIGPANQNDAALEILFHEASHGINDKLEQAISLECKQQNVLLPRRDLWHAILFYTTGEIVRRAVSGYIPYAAANGLWKRAWPMYLDPLDRDWKPYLDGKVPFSTAVSTIVRDVGQPKQ